MRGLVTRTRLAYWLVPVFFLGASVIFQACGDDDDGGLCEDEEILPSEEACETFGAEGDCEFIEFDPDTGICSVNDCECFDDFIDDDDL